MHSHHDGESIMLFPQLRLANPPLGPVVDRLEADHARVSDLLDEVSATAMSLADSEDAEARKRLVAALGELSEDLLAHLQYEEDNISDTLRYLTSWADG